MLGAVLVLLRTQLFGIPIAAVARWVAGAILIAGAAVVVSVAKAARWVRVEMLPKERV